MNKVERRYQKLDPQNEKMKTIYLLALNNSIVSEIGFFTEVEWAQLAEKQKQLKEINEDFTQFMVYLSSPKFQGKYQNQSNNYICATEVFDWIRTERMKTLS